MSTLYGAVDLGNPERQEFFGEARKQLQRYINLQDAEKAAEEKAMQDAGDVPPTSSVGLYQRDFDAAQQMGKILRDKKNEMLSTEEGRRQYQKGVDELSFFLNDRRKYYNTTHPILVQNTRDKKAGVNRSEWASEGLMDSHSLEQYIAKTAELDTNRFKVRFEDGSFVMTDAQGDHDINDPSLVDLSFFDEEKYLTQTPPTRPEDFYNVNRPKNDTKVFENRDQAVEWAASTVMTDPTGLKKRDAIRWFVNSEENQSAEKPLTEAEIMDSPNATERAVDSYADSAISEGWKPYKKKESDSKTVKQKENLSSLADGIATGMSVTTVVDGEEASVQASYAPLDDAQIYVGWSGGEEEGSKYKVDGIYLDDQSRPIIALITSKGTEYVPVDFGDDLFKEINSKMASKYGSGALTQLAKQLARQMD